MCGFENLSREERLIKANEILKDFKLKQAICNKILGTTFKDIEKAMDAIIKERQLTPEQKEELELKKSNPEKFEVDLELDFKINKKAADPKKTDGYRTYTADEVAELLAVSDAPTKEPEIYVSVKKYGTYTREQVEEFMYIDAAYAESEKKWKQGRYNGDE